MTVPGPEQHTRPTDAIPDALPDAPTAPTDTGTGTHTGTHTATTRLPGLRKLGRFARGALADTRPLREPAYRRLFLAGAVTVIGSQLSVVAVPTQIYDLTDSSAYAGLTGAFGLVPLVVFGLWGGAIADAMDRRMLLLLSGAGIALTSLMLWVSAASGVGNVWLVLVLFALQSALLAVNQPARNAVIPRLVSAPLLPAANTLNFTVFTFGAVVGPLLAGVLIPVVGLPTLYLIDAIALLATLWATWRLPALPPPTVEGRRPKAGLREVVDGFRYAATHKVLLVSFLVDGVAMIFGMPRILFPELSERVFGDPPGGGYALGLLFAAIPAGAVLGGLFSGYLTRINRQGVAVTAAVCVWGAAVALSGLTGVLWLAVVLLAVAGAADLVSAVFRNAILQTVATDEMRGRMQGVFIVVVAGGPRIADLWHGPVGAAVGPGITIAVGGLAVIVAVVATMAVFRDFWAYRGPKTPAAQAERAGPS